MVSNTAEAGQGQSPSSKNPSYLSRVVECPAQLFGLSRVEDSAQLFGRSELMDHLEKISRGEDIRESSICDEEGTFTITPNGSNQTLLVGSPDLAQSFVSLVSGDAAPETDVSVTCLLDSGSSIHLLTLPAALKLFASKQASSLKVLGVSGRAVPADLSGHLVLVVEDESGERYELDLGVAHGISSTTVNLLSVSLLIQQ